MVGGPVAGRYPAPGVELSAMVRPRPLLSRPSVRIALGASLPAPFVVASPAAIGAQSSFRHWTSDLQWMAGEHPVAPPYFDAARNLKLGHTPQAKCGPGSRPETSWQGRGPAQDYTRGRAAEGYTLKPTKGSHLRGPGG